MAEAARIEALTALRDALQKAQGPDRTLDYEIGVIAGAWGYFEDFMHDTMPKPYTGSLDAAVTLEDGQTLYVDVLRRPHSVRVEWFGNKDYPVLAVARTEPLARCLARVLHELAKERPDHG